MNSKGERNCSPNWLSIELETLWLFMYVYQINKAIMCQFSQAFKTQKKNNKKKRKRKQQGFQRQQVFAFCVVNFNDEHTKPKFKRKLRDQI